MALEHHWSKCITLEGNYIEKEEVDLNRNKLVWLLIDSPSYLVIVLGYFSFIFLHENIVDTHNKCFSEAFLMTVNILLSENLPVSVFRSLRIAWLRC